MMKMVNSFSIVEDDHSDPDNWETNGVTYRRSKQIETEKNLQVASYGKPKIIFESYLDKSSLQTKLLKKTEIAYDDSMVTRLAEKSMTRKLNFVIEVTKTYDVKGRVIQESNPLGEVTCYTYDG